MPELPEVETVRRGLAPVMEGRVIEAAQVRRPDLRWPFPPDMAGRLEGQRITALRRRSKYLLIALSGGETLLVHLGMTGRMLIAPPAAGAGNDAVSRGAAPGRFVHAHPAPAKHDHVVLDLEGGTRITFNDARRFGAMDLIASDRLEAHWLLAKIGPEPLGNTFDGPYLARALAGRAAPIKSALLDQRVVAGLGNIYVCEVLHRAGISPLRKAGRIAAARIEGLVPLIRQVLGEAIEAGGSSLRDYRQADGDLGYFQHRFAVYDRAGAPCPREGCAGTIRRIVQSGRSSFYCPQCQR
ncbi:bifunctional DNA-formamidopyrimidine glycosylase/DNA-(apurinic or apyrimidinic site) lyase [Profundibacterium mesophilum]|uniref:Formamidopyrimidine-DNA glycosylase n=1 Tax=Profundibacterium mesophilum KAUST100406-0324 TaxID=1037889 RepID=A0A921TD56_9RHOB|nr:bifunctional DNA-formamidopyrimidine glycosylase/DNA-(apurinic or apyrimidinic site) lyase [Profundibacterium mesophilum]KAF0675946.1 Formamidopyrimidine-DNA glycosylase [Profundibacterium mesophilum KAUST100406-0324]